MTNFLKLAATGVVMLMLTPPAFACPNGWSGNPCKPGMNNPPIKRGPISHKELKNKSSQRAKAPIKKGPSVCRFEGKDKYGRTICLKNPKNNDK